MVEIYFSSCCETSKVFAMLNKTNPTRGTLGISCVSSCPKLQDVRELRHKKTLSTSTEFLAVKT
jgi:hypothetical protein